MFYVNKIIIYNITLNIIYNYIKRNSIIKFLLKIQNNYINNNFINNQ